MDGFKTRIGFHLRNGKPQVLGVNTSDHVTSSMEAVFISARDLLQLPHVTEKWIDFDLRN
ncbi:hypothetical protein AAVH_11089 [Aphelenchoides avenae]|nr:hypothetical protein AAVH_11089 [Aphelenchus avenae]